ncbi:MAG: peptide chain release factor-like protein [Chlamydiales bacterium]|nr:peptide chain release factor-like protein [Chlamydiales bacterium]
MAISENKYKQLADRMDRLGIFDKDLIEKFILGSGKGGQKVNKTSSCVYLQHIPTGIEVKCQRERSQELNRYMARKELCDKFEAQILKLKTEKQHEMEKIRRQKRRRTRRQQEKTLEGKRQHSERKTLRRPPTNGD